MKCALKYCGGCNPRFDRVDFVRRLQTRFPQVSFVRPQHAQHEERVDFAVTVCGCASRCAADRELTGEHGGAVVCGEEDFGPLCEKLTQIMEIEQEE